jgi:hypothetical protein
MKQIFDWLREQIGRKSFMYASKDSARRKYIDCADLDKIINEAEAKFSGHAICYFDCPCEYQTDDINVGKIDEYYKKIRAKAISDFLQFIYDNASNEEYANEDGWAMSDLIDLEFKYLEQLKEE